jgi:riboflavin biosynthesis pyrimidine reductase
MGREPGVDGGGARIRWHTNRERRYPFGERSPDPDWFEPIGFPPPWPDRPWIYGVVIASANGVLAWRRASPDDDPVLAVLGDATRPERIADGRHLRHLRCFGDVGFGAQTLRDQPRLVPSPQELGDPPVPALYRFRETHGLPHHPRAIVYSLRGGLELRRPLFNTPGMDVIVVGTPGAAAMLSDRGGRTTPAVGVIAEGVLEPAGLRRAHERLFAERGVRYLACEGGEKILRALRAAEVLDEVFVTVTDRVIDETAYEGVVKIFDFEAEGADLIAEGKISPESGWMFRRWRFNAR